MCIIYTSKGVIKMLGCALSIEKYGNEIAYINLGPVAYINLGLEMHNYRVQAV
jgi:hypothetical protein